MVYFQHKRKRDGRQNGGGSHTFDDEIDPPLLHQEQNRSDYKQSSKSKSKKGKKEVVDLEEEHEDVEKLDTSGFEECHDESGIMEEEQVGYVTEINS